MQNKLVVLYDGWCPLCIKSVGKLEKFNYFKNVEYKSFRDNQKLDWDKLEKKMHGYINNKEYIGLDTFIEILKRSPGLWIFLIPLYISKILGFGNHIYEYIAKNRKIIPSNQCDMDSCNINYRRKIREEK